MGRGDTDIESMTVLCRVFRIWTTWRSRSGAASLNERVTRYSLSAEARIDMATQKENYLRQRAYQV